MTVESIMTKKVFKVRMDDTIGVFVRYLDNEFIFTIF